MCNLEKLLNYSKKFKDYNFCFCYDSYESSIYEETYRIKSVGIINNNVVFSMDSKELFNKSKEDFTVYSHIELRNFKFNNLFKIISILIGDDIKSLTELKPLVKHCGVSHTIDKLVFDVDLKKLILVIS